MTLSPNFSLKVDEEIFLKLIEEYEANILFELVDANRHYLKQFLAWLDQNTSSTHSLSFIKKEIEKFEKMETLTLGIFFSDKLVGLISLHNIDLLNRNASIGYWIAEKYQGKGIIFRSASVLIKYAFTNLKLHRLELRCALHNRKSKNIAEKLGFSNEGILKEAIAHYGVYFDAYLYGLVNRALESC